MENSSLLDPKRQGAPFCLQGAQVYIYIYIYIYTYIHTYIHIQGEHKVFP
jgi:hypothetical protein